MPWCIFTYDTNHQVHFYCFLWAAKCSNNKKSMWLVSCNNGALFPYYNFWHYILIFWKDIVKKEFKYSLFFIFRQFIFKSNIFTQWIEYVFIFKSEFFYSNVEEFKTFRLSIEYKEARDRLFFILPRVKAL